MIDAGPLLIDYDRDKLLVTLERLLAMQPLDGTTVLNQASQLLVEAMSADKIDIFVFNPAEQTLVALGVSETPMANHQREIGLNRLPIANGGRETEVYQSGKAYISGHADLDTGVLRGFRFELGIRSMLIVPLDVNGARQGVIQVAAARSEAYTPHDLAFLKAVAHWIGMVVHQAQLVERLTEATAERARQATAEELITVLAHDLNNYLTPLQGRVRMLQRRATREERQRDFDDFVALAAAVDRLSRLVADLLTVERLEHGLFVPTLQPVDLAALVHETVAALVTQTSPIELKVDEAVDWTVLADAAQLRQALENLLANATKHSPRGMAVKVHMAAEQRQGEDWAEITVNNHGPAIPREMVPRLFRRFAVGQGSNGLGLGLFVARTIAEAHNGTLTYNAGYRDGASFCLALPLAGAELEPTPAATGAASLDGRGA